MGGEIDFIYDQKTAEIIGNGVYGEVKRATYKPNGGDSAIKIINLDSYFNKIGYGINNEIKIKYINAINERISKIDRVLQGNDYENKNFTRYYEKTTIEENTIHFGMELCNFNLSTYMAKDFPNGIDIGNIYDILNQLNNNFKIMKNKKIIHGNIKLENILANLERNKYVFKLSGFEIIPELIKFTKNRRPEVICKYMPPEILKENNFEIDQETDLWSLGVIIYYLFFKEFPFKGNSCQEVLKEINKKYKKKTGFFELDSLIDGLLNVNKEQRLTWEKYFEHPFFDNKVFWADYKIIEKIGEGPFSIVYKAKNKNNEQIAAIKIIDFTKIGKLESNKNNRNDIIKEIKQKVENMERLYNENHNGFIEIYKKYESENYIAIAMELGEFNLKKYIDDIPETKAKALNIFYFLLELNKCLKFLVKKNKIIGDLKLENIILKKKQINSTEYIYKLSDVGLCPKLTKLIKNTSKVSGLLCYIPPELNNINGSYEIKSDLWRLGIIIHYYRFKRFPYEADTFSEIISQIDSGHKRIGSSKNKEFNELIDGLLERDCKKRLKWDEYFHHSFFINRDYTKYYELLEKFPQDSAYYSIYKAKEKKTEKEMIMKIVNKDKIRSKYYDDNIKPINEEIIKKLVHFLVNQSETMKLLEQDGNNQNSVQFHEYFNTQNEFAIVMEKCDTDLNDYFNHRKEKYSFEEIKDLLTQLNNSFKIMAKNKIIHGDLKLENILMKKENDKYIYKLTDYGVSKEFLKLTESLLERNGTPKFRAPEILKEEDFDEKSDLWSLGIIIYTLYFGREPYQGKKNKEVLQNINNPKNKLQLSNDPQFDYLIRKLLTVNPKERFSWEEYFVNPFIDRGDCWKFYCDKDKIGVGPYYDVYRVNIKSNKNESRAVKVIELRKIKKAIETENRRPCTDKDLKPYIDDFIKETENMELLRGPNKDNINTVLFYEYFQTENEFCIVQELCKGNLRFLLQERKKEKEKEKKNKEIFTEKEIYKILSQINNSFQILKNNNLSHKDLRLEKILYKKNEKSNDYIFKLTSLEFNRKVNELLGGGGVMPNEKYNAPEILNNDIPTENISSEKINLLYQKSDLWSLGIIIYLLYFGYFPYEGHTAKEILSDIRKKEKSILNEINDNDLKDLLKKLLNEDRDERIDWDGYFKHRFFAEEKWKNK